MRNKRYNSRQYMTFGKLSLGLLLACACASGRIALATDADAPAAELARRVAALAGPGPAKLIVKNRSPLTASQVAEIRKLLDRDLRVLGVTHPADGAESAGTIRITLSANSAGGLWIAEVQEGTDLRVAMVPVQLDPPGNPHADASITLSKTLLWRQRNPVLDLLVVGSPTTSRMIVLEPERIVSYVAPAGGDAKSWQPEQEFSIPHGQPFPRDMRGSLFSTAQIAPALSTEHLFVAQLPGVHCSGDLQQSGSQLAVTCEDGDDPWPVPGFTTSANLEQRAFYNSARNYFTGVLSPGFNLRLPPFYTAVPAGLPGSAMILSGINGRFELLENGRLKRLTGTRDWGSDLGSIRSGCGTGTQIVASASGSASTDSLRAYEISGQEATPVSPSLDMEGAIQAIWPTPDAREAAVVLWRQQPAVAASGAPRQEDYEVYSIAAHCN